MRILICLLFITFAASAVRMPDALVKDHKHTKYDAMLFGEVVFNKTYLAFLKQLQKYQGRGTFVNIFINSSGGNTWDGMKIIAFMQKMQKKGYKFRCYAIQAQSAAFSIFQACDERVVFKASYLMSHRSHNSDGAEYNHYNYTSDIERLGLEARRIGYSFPMWYKMVERDYVVRGTECEKRNICDVVAEARVVVDIVNFGK